MRGLQCYSAYTDTSSATPDCPHCYRYCAPFLLRDDEDNAYSPIPPYGQKTTTINKTHILPARDSTTSVPLSESGGARNASTLERTTVCDAVHAGVESTFDNQNVIANGDAAADGLARRLDHVEPTLTNREENEKRTSPIGGGHQLPPRRREERSTTSCRRRLRVGFLSAFFFHHSVGLLTQGVVTRLDRSRFETTAIFLQPYPTTVYGETILSNGRPKGRAIGDDVFTAVRQGTENVLDIPAGR